LQKEEVIAKSMRSKRERGDKSRFPTSIVILVQDSINETKPQAAFCERLVKFEISKGDRDGTPVFLQLEFEFIHVFWRDENNGRRAAGKATQDSFTPSGTEE